MVSVASGSAAFTLVGDSPLVAGSISTSFSFIVGGVLTPQTQATVQVTTRGTPTSYSMQLEVSLDNITYYPMDGPITVDGIYLRQYTPEAFGTGANSSNPIQGLNNRAHWLWIRSRVTAVVGGTSPRYTVVGCATNHRGL